MRKGMFILSLVLSWSAAFAQQAPYSSPETPTIATENVVSTLSASTQHSIFLRLLQRAKCIPLLAHINTSTIFAPTDQAWSEWADSNTPQYGVAHGWLSAAGLSEWLDPLDESFDNQNWALRQHLLYHMFNYTVSPSGFAPSTTSNITTHTTLLFPLAEEPDLPRVPPPGPPWLPRGGEGMLGGHGQRLRLARAGSSEGGETGRVGVDWKGDAGAEIWDGGGWKSDDLAKNVTGIRWSSNGAVVGINKVLDPPPSIEEIIQTTPSLSYLSQLLHSDPPSPFPSDLRTTPHITIFAPTNDALDRAFDDVERRYLRSEYGSEAVTRVIGGGVVVSVGNISAQVGWRDAWGKRGDEVPSVLGQDLTVEATSNGSLVVNGTPVEVADIFASNGVIHIVPSILVPDNFTLLNSAEKVLLSLNATRFVNLLRTANLSTTYASESKKSDAWTFLAPTDDVLDALDKWGHGKSLLSRTDELALDSPVKDMTPLQALLQYHILPGRLLPSDIRDGMLLGTELRPSSLKGNRQKLRVDVSDRLGKAGDWADLEQGEVRFGGATALATPVHTGSSIIYLISNLLAPPDDVLQTAVSNLQLSTFLAAVYAADLDNAVKRNPAITYFIPRNRAFDALGLAINYLLLPEGKDELRKVIKYHSIDELVYSDDAEIGRQTLHTLEGGEVVINRSKSRLTLQSPTKWPGWDSEEAVAANGELRPARITHVDTLTATGVIHTIDSVIMPADVKITIAKLIRGSKQTTMLELMARAGLSWIAEGREPSSEEIDRAHLGGLIHPLGNSTPPANIDTLALPSYTVLCPSDKAFSRLNLTKYLSSEEDLLQMLKLHIVPTQSSIPVTGTSKSAASPPADGLPLSIQDDLVYSTLLSAESRYGEIAFRATGDNSWLVGIRNARSGIGHASARIGASGRASVRWTKNRVASAKHGQPSVGSDEIELWRNGMTLGGGVIMIDSVLVPYEPNWFSRWGWLVLTLSGVGLIIIIALASVGWWWYTRKQEEDGYEALEGEEEE